MKKLLPLVLAVLLIAPSCKKEIESKPGYSAPKSDNPSKPSKPNPKDPKAPWGDVKK